MDNEYTWLTRSCPALCDPTDCSLPGSSVQGSLQARTLEWVAVSSPGGLPIPGVTPRSPTSHALAGRFFAAERPPRGFPPLVLIKQSKNPFPPNRNASPTSSKTAKSHFLWTDCTRLFLHFSEKGHPLPLCAHHPSILHPAHPTEQPSECRLDNDHSCTSRKRLVHLRRGADRGKQS